VCFYIVYADEKLNQAMSLGFRNRPQAAINSFRRVCVNLPIAEWVVAGDLPAKQRRVEILKFLRLSGQDLPVHDGVGHFFSPLVFFSVVTGKSAMAT
jgi:hypothetical protein